jgi:hypothetical protein
VVGGRWPVARGSWLVLVGLVVGGHLSTFDRSRPWIGRSASCVLRCLAGGLLLSTFDFRLAGWRPALGVLRSQVRRTSVMTRATTLKPRILGWVAGPVMMWSQLGSGACATSVADG